MPHISLTNGIKDSSHFNIHGIPGTCTKEGDTLKVVFNDVKCHGSSSPGLATIVRGFVTFLQLPQSRGGAILVDDEFSTKLLSDFNF